MKSRSLFISSAHKTPSLLSALSDMHSYDKAQVNFPSTLFPTSDRSVGGLAGYVKVKSSSAASLNGRGCHDMRVNGIVIPTPRIFLEFLPRQMTCKHRILMARSISRHFKGSKLFLPR